MTKGITVNRIPVFILISLMSLFLLVGCGGSSSDASTEKTAEAPAQSGSDEEIIRADVEGLINEHRPNIDSYVAILEKDEELMEIFELTHISPSDYAEAMLRHMDMGVDSVTVEGEAATATIQIKTPDFEKMDEMSND